MDQQGITPDVIDEVAELYRQHRTRLVALAARLTPSRADAEDAVQEAFVVALTQIAAVRPRHPVAWLVAVTRYRALAMRRAHARAAPAGDVIERAVDERRAGEATNGGRCMAEPETVAEVVDLLGRLPLHQRQVLHLWCVDGLSWATVATRMDMPRGRAQSVGYRALRRIRTESAAASS